MTVAPHHCRRAAYRQYAHYAYVLINCEDVSWLGGPGCGYRKKGLERLPAGQTTPVTAEYRGFLFLHRTLLDVIWGEQ